MNATLSSEDPTERRKREWLEAPASYFETDNFGELKVGEQFIFQPIPGDNHGHGGFKGTHGIFTKTTLDIHQTESGLKYGVPHGAASDKKTTHVHHFPHSMSVIKVA